MADDTHRVSVDAWVDEARPATNYGQAAFLSLNGNSGSQRQAFLYFGIPFQPGDTVFDATLRLFIHGSWTGANIITAERITVPWSENSIRWSNRPTVDTLHSAQVTVTGGVDRAEYDLDLTSMLQDVAAGSPFYGVRLRIDTTSLRTLFAAEHPDQTMRAQLEIDWSRLPFEADNLNPSGGLAVSVSLPVVSWQFDSEDPDAERTQAYSQVQISTSTDFTSPVYDSGKVANTDSSWDLSTAAWTRSLGTFTVTIASPAVFTKTAHGLVVGDKVFFTTTGSLPTGLTANTPYYVSGVPGANTFRVSATPGGADVNTSGTQSGTHTLNRYGIANTETRYWRVKVWDDRNQASEWSATVSFQRQTKGTLAISNPPAPAGNTVNETTPPITFSLTNRTQERVKIILYQLDGSRQIEKWVYPKTVTTDTSIEIPSNIIKSTEQYRVAVIVWDTIDRATTQGDPAYVMLTRDFTYVRNGAVASVTNLTATQFGPGVVLTFHRTTGPLYFGLRVDGVEIRDDIIPSDVFVSGDLYQFYYYGAVSGVSHTYEVEAIDPSAGQLKHSQSNDTDTLTLDITAKWLVDDYDPANPEVVKFMQRQQTDLTLAKSSTVYNTVAGQRPIEIIDAVRGYEGTVSGLLEDTDAKEKLEQMVARARPIRFIQSTTNIPVEIQGAPNIAPASDHIGDLYQASVPLAQVNEFLTVPST